MLEFILNLSFWQGLILTTTTICISGLTLIWIIKRIVQPHLTKEHEKVGRLLFRVTAGLIALLVSLSYANERVAQSKIVDSLEAEASLIVNSILILDMIDDPGAMKIRMALIDYVSMTMTKNWQDIGSDPFFSKAPTRLREAYKLAVGIDIQDPDSKALKERLINNLDQVVQLMQVRVYSSSAILPNLIYILFLGLFLMWTFFTVYKLDTISLSFITLYNLFIGVLIYFILALSNPLTGPLKIDANAFEVVDEKIIQRQFN